MPSAGENAHDHGGQDRRRSSEDYAGETGQRNPMEYPHHGGGQWHQRKERPADLARYRHWAAFREHIDHFGIGKYATDHLHNHRGDDTGFSPLGTEATEKCPLSRAVATLLFGSYGDLPLTNRPVDQKTVGTAGRACPIVGKVRT